MVKAFQIVAIQALLSGAHTQKNCVAWAPQEAL